METPLQSTTIKIIYQLLSYFYSIMLSSKQDLKVWSLASIDPYLPSDFELQASNYGVVAKNKMVASFMWYLLANIKENTLINFQELLDLHFTFTQERELASLEPKEVWLKCKNIIDGIVKSQDLEIYEKSGMQLWRIDDFLEYFKEI